MRLRNVIGEFLWVIPVLAGTFFLLVKFGEQISMEHRAEVAVNEALAGLDIAVCRADPLTVAYLQEADNALWEASQDAQSYYLRKEADQESQLAARFQFRFLQWQAIEPPACLAVIHEHMLDYFRAYERAYTVKYEGILGEILDPVYSGYIGVGVENLEIAWRLIDALKDHPRPPGNYKFLQA